MLEVWGPDQAPCPEATPLRLLHGFSRGVPFLGDHDLAGSYGGDMFNLGPGLSQSHVAQTGPQLAI